VLCEGWRATGRLFRPTGLAVFVLVGLGWYIAAIIRYPWLLNYFLHEEVYGRIFTSMYKRHAGSMGWIVAFAPVLVFGTAPWWPGLYRAIRAASATSSWKNWRRERSVQCFLVLWFALPFVIFCLAKSRLPLYLLPLFLPLALLASAYTRPAYDPGERRSAWLLGAWIVALLVVKGVAAYGHAGKPDNRVAAREITASTRGLDYRALVFIEKTTDTYAIEEQTPWGVRLYVDKPVYAIRWQDDDAAAQVCAAIDAQQQPLLLVDRDITWASLDQVLHGCHATVEPVGTWRQDALFLVAH
jgi:hypothetical protein